MKRLLEPGSADPEAYDDAPLDRPDLLTVVPRDLRFWATVR